MEHQGPQASAGLLALGPKAITISAGRPARRRGISTTSSQGGDRDDNLRCCAGDTAVPAGIVRVTIRVGDGEEKTGIAA
jgi:hypothetical protein